MVTDRQAVSRRSVGSCWQSLFAPRDRGCPPAPAVHHLPRRHPARAHALGYQRPRGTRAGDQRLRCASSSGDHAATPPDGSCTCSAANPKVYRACPRRTFLGILFSLILPSHLTKHAPHRHRPTALGQLRSYLDRHVLHPKVPWSQRLCGRSSLPPCLPHRQKDDDQHQFDDFRS